MPRRPKYPPQVLIRIPKDVVNVYETPIFELIFSREEARVARMIVEFIKKNERLYPDEYKEFIKTPADRARYFRVLRKMVSLGMLKRGKEGSYILSDEFAHKLGAMIEKWRAILR
ncbi:hypothetical protein [Pyrococcus kukulkanii]|uniref:hypothetical protein n=1 Tax=Pyrococcus kukulkanii TaxID=1609559 RepID=UPI0035630799